MFWETREHDHLFGGKKGYFLDKFEDTKDIPVITGNFDKIF